MSEPCFDEGRGVMQESSQSHIRYPTTHQPEITPGERRVHIISEVNNMEILPCLWNQAQSLFRVVWGYSRNAIISWLSKQHVEYSTDTTEERLQDKEAFGATNSTSF